MWGWRRALWRPALEAGQVGAAVGSGGSSDCVLLFWSGGKGYRGSCGEELGEGLSTWMVRWSVLGRGGVKWGRKWGDDHKGRTGRGLSRNEISQKGESLFGSLCRLKSICSPAQGLSAVIMCPGNECGEVCALRHESHFSRCSEIRELMRTGDCILLVGSHLVAGQWLEQWQWLWYAPPIVYLSTGNSHLPKGFRRAITDHYKTRLMRVPVLSLPR